MKGYLTIGLGDYYAHLASNLYMSYRLNTNADYPFAVITDEPNAESLKTLFDIVIVRNDNQGFASKLDILEYSPFDETIFIDADCTVIRDFGEWWDLFASSGFAVTVFGENYDLSDRMHGHLLSETAIQKHHLDRYINFNGGVYYFRKSPVSESVFRRAKQLMDTYEAEHLPLFDGKKGDEPVMEISMLEHKIFAVEDPKRERMFCTPGMTRLRINVLRQKCSFLKYGTPVNPAVMHWGTKATKGRIYRRESKAVHLAYNGCPKALAVIIGYLWHLRQLVLQ